MMNSAARTSPKESAPYGKACAGCAKAKCKCVLLPDNTRTCERCHRLQKQCVPAPLVRKRALRTSKGRTAKLEEKLDSLVSLLSYQQQQQQQQQPHHYATPDGASLSGSGQSIRASGRAQSVAISEPLRSDTAPTHDAGLPVRAAYSPHTLSSASDPDQQDDVRCLQMFRENQLPSFPFFHIAEETTPADMQRDYPFLWRVIQGICASSTEKQGHIEQEIREKAARALLVDLHRDLDHLLGLIAYMTWLKNKFGGKPVLSVFSNLARSMMFDLRLDRYATELPCRELQPAKAYGCPMKRAVAEVVWTNVERRAVLGCYVMCATIAWFIKTATVGWTPHMETCLQALAANAEGRHDHVLVAIARSTVILEDVNALCVWNPAETKPACHSAMAGVSPGVHVKTLRASLELMKSMTPPEVLDDKYVISHLSAVEAMIYELPLQSPSPIPPPPLPPLSPVSLTTNSNSNNNWVAMSRTAAFATCLSAAARCLENYLSFTSAQIFGHSCAIHMHFSAMTHILYRLCLNEDPCWDRAQIFATVDLFGCVERCSELYKAVPVAVGIATDGSDIYNLAGEMLKTTMANWRRIFEEVGALTPSQEPPPPLQDVDWAQVPWAPEADVWFMNWASGPVENGLPFP